MKIVDILEKVKILFENTLTEQSLLQEKSSSGLTRNQLEEVIEVIAHMENSFRLIDINENTLSESIKEQIKTVDRIFTKNMN